VDKVSRQEEADPKGPPVFMSSEVKKWWKDLEIMVTKLNKRPKPKPPKVEKDENKTDTNATKDESPPTEGEEGAKEEAPSTEGEGGAEEEAKEEGEVKEEGDATPEDAEASKEATDDEVPSEGEL